MPDADPDRRSKSDHGDDQAKQPPITIEGSRSPKEDRLHAHNRTARD
jgi:hypothetical protein